VLASFDGSNGAYPLSGLTLGPDNNFYGGPPAAAPSETGPCINLACRPFLSPNQPANPWSSATPPLSVPRCLAPPRLHSNGVPTTFPRPARSRFVEPARRFLPGQQCPNPGGGPNTYGSATSQVANLSVVLQPNCSAVLNLGGGNYTVVVGSYPAA